jgi:hypothetical protein
MAKASGFILKWVILIINITIPYRLNTKRKMSIRFDRQHQGHLQNLQGKAHQLLGEHSFLKIKTGY